ncbi:MULTISPECIES: PEP-CTERM sorting domain-containing protein [unclassified Lentimonas]|uniref:PEP-CTERM sorting domain-containing protein n=1 Tax=unclassified Lentimonas TaxID=2630993 RepID=UPI001324B0C3|nr:MULTISPECIES: PEP-CTERM sorting domain-containing protein [unclassified Lentimonas]CAA6679112.1 Unannotated [Lentimonas sp. CC4]CAA6684145.1 Unannotated [Lentimonas sp. CC6]CAA7076480.1 Unannotated [Lentimonas sp. CC4]CAA7170416.1 Unannotated [Lentimonas sp. CC21]CAA7182811.1 Unannotated [Lentimonas sp. CC8]
MKPVYRIFLLLCTFFGASAPAYAILTALELNDSTDNWTALDFVGQSDYYSDEKANKAGGDFVGNPDNTQSGFYKRYDFGDIENDPDDIASIAFRVRLDTAPTTKIYIGFDVAGDSGEVGPNGRIDFYIQLDSGKGTVEDINFFTAGTDGNLSPSTSSFAYHSTYISDTDPNVDNYANISPVVLGGNEGYDGLDASNDLDGVKNNVDYFVSFQVDMVSLNAAYQSMYGYNQTLDEDSAMMLVLGSATNDNSFNGDVAGINGTAGADLIWTDPNGVGAPIDTASGTLPASPVPEPSSYALIFGVFVGSLVFFRRRR